VIQKYSSGGEPKYQELLVNPAFDSGDQRCLFQGLLWTPPGLSTQC